MDLPADAVRRGDRRRAGRVLARHYARGSAAGHLRHDQREPLSGHTTTHLDTLRFPNEALLRTSLAAGLAVEEILGAWDASPVTAASAELVVIARKP